jgi:hypothetical protein
MSLTVFQEHDFESPRRPLYPVPDRHPSLEGGAFHSSGGTLDPQQLGWTWIVSHSEQTFRMSLGWIK